MKFKVGSLFAGVGGIDLGFLNAKTKDSSFDIAWANEIDDRACVTYRTNFSNLLLEGDIRKILNPPEIEENNTDSLEEHNKYEEMHKQILSEEIDVLVGGFPCQPFSVAGKMEGFKDERGNLFLYIIELINQLDKVHKKPRVLFLENVKKLLTHDDGRTYKIIKEKLTEAGYIVYEKVLNTMEYSDLPQNRERMYIVCFRDKKDADNFHGFDEDFLKSKKVSHTKKEYAEICKKLIDYTSIKDEKYYYTRAKYPHFFLSEEEYEAQVKKKKIRINMDETITEMYQFYQCRYGLYLRQNMSNVCPTLTANMGFGGHNVPIIKVDSGIRKLTPEEVFKLQGFPVGTTYKLPTKYKNKEYVDSYLYKQAGNSVSVPIVELIAREILKAIS